jgi:hypothetical protein
MSDARILVPRFEPEVVAAGAKKHFCGDDKKVLTTSLSELMHCGVAIVSRYGKADEFETMAAMLDGISSDLWRYIDTLFCDSKMGNSYSVGLRRCGPAQGREIAAQLADFITAYKGGHSGIRLENADGTVLVDVDPDWSFIEGNGDV